MMLPPSFVDPSASFAALSDSALLAEVERLAGDERQAGARLIGSLAELDERRLYLECGCSSLFTFCTQVLHLSEHEAYLRIEAARTARRFPLILARLAEGSVTLSAVSLLRPHLTSENHVVLLDEARHRSKRELEALIARLAPKPDAPATVRRVAIDALRATTGCEHPGVDGTAATALDQPVSRKPDPSDPAHSLALRALVPREERDTKLGGREPDADPEERRRDGAPAAATPIGVGARFRAERATEDRDVNDVEMRSLDRTSILPASLGARTRSVVTALSPARYKVQVTIGAETHDKLRRVQDLLRHVVPNGDLETVFDRAIGLLLADLERTRLAAAVRPRESAEPSAGSRYIPAAVKRAVWRRDEGRCAFIGTHGRCRETGLLQFHHIVPFAAGGTTTIDNLQVRCAMHNRGEAEVFFGPQIGKRTRADVPCGSVERPPSP